MPLTPSDFHPVTFATKPLLDKYLDKYPHDHSENSAVTILSWSKDFPCTMAEYQGVLIIDCLYEGRHSIHAPIGPYTPELFDEIYRYAQSVGAGFEIFGDTDLKFFQSLHPELDLKPEREYFEYCWYTETLANLSGKSFVGIRKQINRFRKTYPYTTEPVTVENREEVRAMIHRWSAEKQTEPSVLIQDETEAADISLDNFDEFRLEGLIIRIHGEIGAVAIWENRDYNLVFIHYEKGLKKYPGIYKIINWETAKYLKSRYTVINREGDMNDAGLREAKLRYHPDFFITTHFLEPENKT